MWGVDRKIHPKGHCLASRGLPSDARLWSCRVMPDCDPKGQTFLSTPHNHLRVFFLHTFHFWTWIADVHHMLMTLLWRLVMSLHSVASTLTTAARQDSSPDIAYFVSGKS